MKKRKITETRISDHRKNLVQAIMVGVLFTFCLFSTSQKMVAQSIKLKGGTCVTDTIVEIPGGIYKYARATFIYTLDEKTPVSALNVLIDKGLFVIRKKKYKPHAIIRDVEEIGKEARRGSVSLLVSVPANTDVSSLKFVLNKQEFSFIYKAR